MFFLRHAPDLALHTEAHASHGRRLPWGLGTTVHRTPLSLATALALFFAGCTSVTPAGTMPAGVSIPAGSCEELAGRFKVLGQAFQEQQRVTNNHGDHDASILDVHKGCINSRECQLPSMATQTPQSFQLQVSPNTGWSVVYFDAKNTPVGEQRLDSSSVSCNNGALAVTLHDGFRPATPGAWTVGRETLSIEYWISADQNLVARRTSKTADIFWFGLPVWSESGKWYIHERTTQ